MSRHQIAALLDRYLKGETTSEENELVKRWLEENSNANPRWHDLDRSAKDRWLSVFLAKLKTQFTKRRLK